ncbi:hypothetical protein [Rathayibacter festucae]|uniref:hypothetical protein n=1 Tax=Rathayibacter festucae TaxID=110937 RepID=UPI002A6A4439|nr:hypothetical protein [Rathayibacter festucae]MDY0912281.1 hypothetical protein [Rathayibacter festucae]
MFLACLAGAPVLIGIVWLVSRSEGGSRDIVRRDTGAGAFVVSALFIVGAVVLSFVPVETSNDAQASFGASTFTLVALLLSGILGLFLTLILRLAMPGEAGADRE